MLLDTNIVIYLAQPGYEELEKILPPSENFVSLISKVEAMGFHRISEEEQRALEQVFSWLEILPVD